MGGVTLVNDVPVTHRPVAQLESVIGGSRYTRLLDAADQFRQRLAGRRIWNVNSTATGGGVAEMLQALVGYVADLGIPAQWTVIGGDPAFFAITKRLHNRIHGAVGDDGDLGTAEAEHYEAVLRENAAELATRLGPGDLVLLHDPQTAGLVAPLARAGATVVWRCHIGADRENAVTETAWRFLRPYLEPAHGFVFSRRQYVPSWVPDGSTWIIPPSIDPFSAKNQELTPETVRAALATIGAVDDARPDKPGRFMRDDGSTGEIVRAASVVGARLPGPGDPVVVQVSRWDRLKDMAGVMRGFADHAARTGPGYLMVVGPAVNEVSDDPEGAAVYAECVAMWHELPAECRARVLLVTLPLDDVDENAAMVNAVQRHASVLAQKSLAEGFGLTVAEGMWKGRPVIGSAVGGIQDQIVDGTGVLLADPTDLTAFGVAVRQLLDHPDEAERMGRAAHTYIREHFVGDLHLLRYAELFGTLLARG
jgi:trehalose synthase